MPPDRRRARRSRVKPAEAPAPTPTVAPATPAVTVPQVGTPEWDKAHLDYLQDELAKYESSNPEAATRLRQRIKDHKAKMKV